MELISIVGAFLVTLALLAYGYGSISIQRYKIITKSIVSYLTLGILLDIAATICMIIGSKNTPFTMHGFLGYSGFFVMMVDLILVLKIYAKKGLYTKIEKSLINYTKIAYGWWVIAYITGGLLVVI